MGSECILGTECRWKRERKKPTISERVIREGKGKGSFKGIGCSEERRGGFNVNNTVFIKRKDFCVIVINFTSRMWFTYNFAIVFLFLKNIARD